MNLVRKLIDSFGKTRVSQETALQQLGGLPGDYLLFSTVLYNDNEIGHLVFNRKQGLFLINVAADRGDVTYDGAYLCINATPRSDHIKKTLKDTFWLKTTIREQIGVDAPITPIVVFEQARVAVDKPILGVRVIESGRLFETLTGAPEKEPLADGVLFLLRELHINHTMTYRKL